MIIVILKTKGVDVIKGLWIKKRAAPVAGGGYMNYFIGANLIF
jgi:hypothetical protein